MERPDQPPGPHALIAAIADALARGGDGSATLLRIAASEVGAEGAAVFARDPERDDLILVASVGTGPTVPDEPTVVAAIQGLPAIGRTVETDGAEETAADLPLRVARGGVELGLGSVTFRWVGRRPWGTPTRSSWVPSPTSWRSRSTARGSRRSLSHGPSGPTGSR